jgi:cobalt-zinc-cadmium efflux system outer membrane protein
MIETNLPSRRARIAAALAAAALFLLPGCGSVNPRPSFHDVQQTVQSQTGHRVQWLQGGKEDRAVEESVAALLRQELTADAAVQIALVNNRSLQAELEEIGIAQADLVQAGLLKNPGFRASARFPDRPPSAANT